MCKQYQTAVETIFVNGFVLYVNYIKLNDIKFTFNPYFLIQDN